MKHLEERNQKIIDALIEKANRVCPGTLALIGIYGSFMTGDTYEKSDLDLLVLINDDKGWQLGHAFIQDDIQVGHDIYCTNWDSLENDACYNNPNISKLMDSKIVYYADEKYIEQLEALRKKVNDKLSQPFSKEDYLKAEKLLKEAEHFYTMAMIAETMSDVWAQAGNAIYYIENAIAMLNKKYFHYGTKRVYEELESMEHRPKNLCEMTERVLLADSLEAAKQYLTILMKETILVFEKVKETVSATKNPVAAENMGGTYEEMYSNWRNKMYAAAEQNNRHLAFMSLNSLNAMISEIGDEVTIDNYDVLGGYDPNDLQKTAEAYDEILRKYLKEYERANIPVNHYSDIDAFVREYRKN